MGRKESNQTKLHSPKSQRRVNPKYIVPVVQMQMIPQMKNSYKI